MWIRYHLFFGFYDLCEVKERRFGPPDDALCPDPGLQCLVKWGSKLVLLDGLVYRRRCGFILVFLLRFLVQYLVFPVR